MRIKLSDEGKGTARWTRCVEGMLGPGDIFSRTGLSITHAVKVLRIWLELVDQHINGFIGRQSCHGGLAGIDTRFGAVLVIGFQLLYRTGIHRNRGIGRPRQ